MLQNQDFAAANVQNQVQKVVRFPVTAKSTGSVSTVC
jgi:hypothetical protein